MQESGPEDSGLFHHFTKFWQNFTNKTAKINTNTSIDKLNSTTLRVRNYVEGLKRNLNKDSQDLNSSVEKKSKTKGNIVTPRPKQFYRVM